MAHKLLVVVAAVLLAAAAAEGRTLRAADDSTSAVSQLGGAASEGAGGSSSTELQEKVAQFYFQVQDVAQKIATAKANVSADAQQQYKAFKAQLDTLEVLWRDGRPLALALVPAQLGRVSGAADNYAAFAQQQAATLQGEERAQWEALVAALQQLEQSASALQKSALAELEARVKQAARDQAAKALHEGEARFAKVQEALANRTAQAEQAARDQAAKALHEGEARFAKLQEALANRTAQAEQEARDQAAKALHEGEAEFAKKQEALANRIAQAQKDLAAGLQSAQQRQQQLAAVAKDRVEQAVNAAAGAAATAQKIIGGFFNGPGIFGR